MTDTSKTVSYVPRFLPEKNEKTFREVCKNLEGLTLEEISLILRAVSEVVPKFTIFRKF